MDVSGSDAVWKCVKNLDRGFRGSPYMNISGVSWVGLSITHPQSGLLLASLYSSQLLLCASLFACSNVSAVQLGERRFVRAASEVPTRTNFVVPSANVNRRYESGSPYALCI